MHKLYSVDTVQGRATDSGIWKYIDPAGTIKHTEPKKPEPCDCEVTATKYAELSDDEKAMFKEDNAQYRVDIQSFKHECKPIGEMRSKIVDSLQKHHRPLIFGHMTCQEVLKQIKNRLEPAEDLQKLKIIDDYSKARSTPSNKKIEMWLMEWERLDIMIKRLKIADFSDYKLIQDFLSSANSLLPMWVTSKRMEIVKGANKSNLKFLDVILEFRQFWALTEFETESSISAFSATLQILNQPSRQPSRQSKHSNNNQGKQRDNSRPKKCICGNIHSGQDCSYLAEGKAPYDFDRGEEIISKFKDACDRPAFRGVRILLTGCLRLSR
ncbi:hypothetical protein K3495_g15806 [Podosphaera aphanis]|nr:hypothetical protein K3495_g15806 [Podosphaera aphanis]